MTPRLASVVTPRQAIGEAAAGELLARLRGEKQTQKVVDLGYRIEVGMTL
jgi:LacI family gluconate utilization system Gnt-I transcriptional repressor